jgi:ribosome-associated protein
MKTIEYPLTHASFDYIELNHLLKLTGFADSGGSGGALVSTGVVKVDGKIELRKRNKIRVGQVVQIEDTEIRVLPNPDGLVLMEGAKAKPTSKPTTKPRTPGPTQRRRPRDAAKSAKPRMGAK